MHAWILALGKCRPIAKLRTAWVCIDRMHWNTYISIFELFKKCGCSQPESANNPWWLTLLRVPEGLESGRRKTEDLTAFLSITIVNKNNGFSNVFISFFVCAQVPVESGEHVEPPGVGVPGAISCFTWVLQHDLGSSAWVVHAPSSPQNKNLKPSLNIQSGVEVQVENVRGFSLPSHTRKEAQTTTIVEKFE